MENSQKLNKYGQSVTTRRLRDCFIITNHSGGFGTNKNGVFLIRVTVNRTKKKKLNMSGRKKES